MILLGQGAAAIGFGLGDDPCRSVLRLVHRTMTIVGAAGHARFRGRHPAGADARLTNGDREGQESRRKPVAEAQHLLRMRDRATGVKR